MLGVQRKQSAAQDVPDRIGLLRRIDSLVRVDGRGAQNLGQAFEPVDMQLVVAGDDDEQPLEVDGLVETTELSAKVQDALQMMQTNVF